jgi:hypothetical protein
MLIFGQERSRDNDGLSCRAMLCPRFYLSHSGIEYSDGVSESHNHLEGVANANFRLGFQIRASDWDSNINILQAPLRI